MSTCFALENKGKTEARERPDADRAWLLDHSRTGSKPQAILFHASNRSFQTPGGGENQLIRTGHALEVRDMSIRLFSAWVDRLSDFRLLHLFGMSREGLELAREAKSQGVPIALSSICWFEPRAMYSLASNSVSGMIDVGKWKMKAALPWLPSWRGDLLGLADVILPNSQSEADQLTRLFGVSERKIQVVPNGVDGRFADADPGLFQSIHGDTPFVLYVGRIEPRKNVLRLIEAAKMAQLPILVIGRIPSGCEIYAERCWSSAGPGSRFLNAVAHEDPILASAYAAARVFALPSWFETPGLAALEAATAGTAIVLTPYGCTREYFENGAIYARPNRVGEIANALKQAWDEGPRPGLAERLRTRYLWEEVARKTAEAYDHIS